MNKIIRIAIRSQNDFILLLLVHYTYGDVFVDTVVTLFLVDD